MGAITVIQVKDACGLDWSGNSRGSEEILDSKISFVRWNVLDLLMD